MREALHNSWVHQYQQFGLMTKYVRQESIDLPEVNLGYLSSAAFQSFVLVQAPQRQTRVARLRVLSRPVFVATDGLWASIYMANTIKWKSVRDRKWACCCCESFVPVKHWKGAKFAHLSTDMQTGAKQTVQMCLSVFWEAFPEIRKDAQVCLENPNSVSSVSVNNYFNSKWVWGLRCWKRHHWLSLL